MIQEHSPPLLNEIAQKSNCFSRWACAHLYYYDLLINLFFLLSVLCIVSRIFFFCNYHFNKTWHASSNPEIIMTWLWPPEPYLVNLINLPCTVPDIKFNQFSLIHQKLTGHSCYTLCGGCKSSWVFLFEKKLAFSLRPLLSETIYMKSS